MSQGSIISGFSYFLRLATAARPPRPAGARTPACAKGVNRNENYGVEPGEGRQQLRSTDISLSAGAARPIATLPDPKFIRYPFPKDCWSPAHSLDRSVRACAHVEDDVGVRSTYSSL